MPVISPQHKTIWILLILQPEETPEVRSFACKADAEESLMAYLSETGLDDEGNSLDIFARPIERCVHESRYLGKDGTRCFLLPNEIE